MNSKIIDSIAILTAILLLIFSAFVFTNKKGKVISHKLLAAFLFANALFIIDFALQAIENAVSLNLHWFRGIGFTFGFLFGPLLYFYTKSITQKNFSLRLSQSVHIVLFVLVFVIILFKIRIPIIYTYSLLLLQTMPYMVACFPLILDYRRKIKNFHSSIDKLSLTWMLYVVGAFFIMWIVDLIDFILILLKLIGPVGDSYLIFLSLIINFTFAILIFYKALQHPEIFRDIPEEEKNQKYQQSRLTEYEKEKYIQKLEAYFLSKKPFLNPDLTINDLSQELNISSKYISQVINQSLQRNFYDFINYYRIEEAKKQLKNENGLKKTVLEILYDSGFNSKSAFHTAFKKYTGYTPTQYRKNSAIN